jgi:hypothetical protein
MRPKGVVLLHRLASAKTAPRQQSTAIDAIAPPVTFMRAESARRAQ